MDSKTQKLLGLAIGLSGGSTQEWANAVERSGQSQLVNEEMLPKDMGAHFYDGLPAGCSTPREVYERMGIVFGADVDDIFVKATLPAGWKKVRTDHYMWSKVVDEKGRERISIFYKPEFYDRSAYMSPCNRYGIGSRYSDDNSVRTVFIRDGQTEIHVIGTVTRPANGATDWREYDRQDKDTGAAAKAWLNEHYPEWQNPLAYWD